MKHKAVIVVLALCLALGLLAWRDRPWRIPPPKVGDSFLVNILVNQPSDRNPLREGDIYVREIRPTPGPRVWQGTYRQWEPWFTLHLGRSFRDDDEFEVTVESRSFWQTESAGPKAFERESSHNEVAPDREDAKYNWDNIALCAAPLVLVTGMWLARFTRSAPPPTDPFSHAVDGLANVASSWDPQSRLLLPRDLRVHQYLVVGLLGSGGMAAVYKVTDAEGAFYALKIPHADALAREDTRQRFEREVAICVGLIHPNIVRTFDAGTYETAPAEADGGAPMRVPYLVMELVSGGELDQTLTARVRSGQPPELAYARTVVDGILSGLAFAHERGIVHRDIKPSNIMMTKDGGVKIMDFGIAHATMMKTLTATGTVMGTPTHMAPEQVASQDPDARADVYAAGVVLFQLLTHDLPFPQGPDAGGMLMAKLNTPARAPITLNPAVGTDMNDLVMSMLATDPGERCPSAREALRRLRDCRLP